MKITNIWPTCSPTQFSELTRTRDKWQFQLRSLANLTCVNLGVKKIISNTCWNRWSWIKVSESDSGILILPKWERKHVWNFARSKWPQEIGSHPLVVGIYLASNKSPQSPEQKNMMSENERNTLPTCHVVSWSLSARLSDSELAQPAFNNLDASMNPNITVHEIDPLCFCLAKKSCSKNSDSYLFSHPRSPRSTDRTTEELRQLTQKLLRSILTPLRSISSSSCQLERLQISSAVPVPYPRINIRNNPNHNRNFWNKLDIQTGQKKCSRFFQRQAGQSVSA